MVKSGFNMMLIRFTIYSERNVITNYLTPLSAQEASSIISRLYVTFTVTEDSTVHRAVDIT